MKSSEAAPTYAEYLRGCAMTPEDIARSLDGRLRWSLHPHLGFVERDYTIAGGGVEFPGLRLPGGSDGSAVFVKVREDGARRSFVHADGVGRISTYGDSFTHGDQVNDGECWQEYLAGHLQEPIRNFGVGGASVYQTYRRMVLEESKNPSELVVFYIWGDDSTRSLLGRSMPLIRYFPQTKGVLTLSAPSIAIDLDSGAMVERDNPFPSVASLERLTDAQWIVDNYREELALQLFLYHRGRISDVDETRAVRLAELLGFRLDLSRPDAQRRAQAGRLLDQYAQRTSIFVLEKAMTWVGQGGQKLLVALFDPVRSIRQMHRQERRHDQDVVDHLLRGGFEYFDMNEVHLRDHQRYRIEFDEYMGQFFVDGAGHYNPLGNHLFAYSIKDRVVSLLRPLPAPYLDAAEMTVHFKDYLFNGKLASDGRIQDTSMESPK
ncbi:hypothetical protein [Streptomyces sp. SID3343]|uniref:hypothetical protein n=1 Tax=Streptomyces sp. SID3343 TaxID=2690260 RepID=UPI00136CDFBC|nr:hypothetical protein [Streptomyces sp. SID3343]MYV97009.1 hypothetical protein [Streptomyces sp. SID3343]